MNKFQSILKFLDFEYWVFFGGLLIRSRRCARWEYKFLNILNVCVHKGLNHPFKAMRICMQSSLPSSIAANVIYRKSLIKPNQGFVGSVGW